MTLKESSVTSRMREKGGRDRGGEKGGREGEREGGRRDEG